MPNSAKTDRANILFQFIRFGITGGLVTLIAVMVYWTSADILHVPVLVANLLAYIVCILVGYSMHGRWSFADDSRQDRPGGAGLRYVIVSVIGLALNSFWVWLLVVHLGGATWWPIAPMVLITPAATFGLNRQWVFGPTSSSLINH